MQKNEQDSGKSVALAVAAVLSDKSDQDVWAALDAANAGLEAALDDGDMRRATVRLAAVEALTAEVKRRSQT